MSKRFLVADDNQTARRVIAEILTSCLGWSVCAEAGDGVSAVELSLAQRPDLIILDVQMPHMTGVEAARQILNVLPDALILLISFHEPRLILPEIKDTKIRGFVSKTILGRDLISAVETLFAGGRYFEGLPASFSKSGNDARGNFG